MTHNLETQTNKFSTIVLSLSSYKSPQVHTRRVEINLLDGRPFQLLKNKTVSRERSLDSSEYRVNAIILVLNSTQMYHDILMLSLNLRHKPWFREEKNCIKIMPLCETWACYPSGNVSDYYLTNIYTWNLSTFQCAPKTGTQQKLQIVLLLSHFHNCVLSTYFFTTSGTDGVLFPDNLGQNHTDLIISLHPHVAICLNKTHNCELGGCKKLEMLSNRKLDSYKSLCSPTTLFLVAKNAPAKILHHPWKPIFQGDLRFPPK